MTGIAILGILGMAFFAVLSTNLAYQWQNTEGELKELKAKSENDAENLRVTRIITRDCYERLYDSTRGYIEKNEVLISLYGVLCICGNASTVHAVRDKPSDS